MKAVYFAWVRERIGKTEEELDPPAAVTTVADLIAWLRGRGEGYAYAFEKASTVRAALDRVHAQHDATIAGAQRDRLLPADDRRLRFDGDGPRPAPRISTPARRRAALARGRRDVGALVSFVGLCRDEGGPLAALELEHYPGMAEAEIARVAAEAEARWPLLGVTAIHRFGRSRPANISCWWPPPPPIAARPSRRREMLMDYLKTRAPFWKRAIRKDGVVEGWVEAKESDDAVGGALERRRGLSRYARRLMTAL